MKKEYRIRELCGDWALDIPMEKTTVVLLFNSRVNAELVKAILEHEDAHPNKAVPYISTQINGPLTLEQLREMIGQPVWIESNDKKEWCILWGYHCPEVYGRSMIFTRRTSEKKQYQFSDYGKTWLAYAYSPIHIDREAWEPCEYCNGKTNLYQHTHTTKLFMNTFGEAAILITKCMACPPYADCCMNGISVNSAFKINFCPNCGRPLTEEAWQEFEKKVRGEK